MLLDHFGLLSDLSIVRNQSDSFVSVHVVARLQHGDRLLVLGTRVAGDAVGDQRHCFVPAQVGDGHVSRRARVSVAVGEGALAATHHLFEGLLEILQQDEKNMFELPFCHELRLEFLADGTPPNGSNQRRRFPHRAFFRLGAPEHTGISHYATGHFPGCFIRS